MDIANIVVGTPRAEWCDGCMTTSLIVCDVQSITEGGVSLLATHRECPNCADN